MKDLTWEDPQIELKLFALNVPRDRIASIMESRPRPTQVFALLPSWDYRGNFEEEVRMECIAYIRPAPETPNPRGTCEGASWSHEQTPACRGWKAWPKTGTDSALENFTAWAKIGRAKVPQPVPKGTVKEQAELAAVACLARLDMSEGDRSYYVQLLAEPIAATISAVLWDILDDLEFNNFAISTPQNRWCSECGVDQGERHFECERGDLIKEIRNRLEPK